MDDSATGTEAGGHETSGTRFRASLGVAVPALVVGFLIRPSFGPDMTLAASLLRKGEREGVLHYFEACRRFWKMDGGALTRWAEDVRAGRTPDFGRQARFAESGA